MSLEELKSLPEFPALTPDQRVWILAFISNGNKADEAARTVNPKVKNPVQSGRWFHTRPQIKSLLDQYYGRSAEDEKLSRGEFLGILAREIRRGSDEMLKAMQLYVKVEGWDSGKTEPPDDIEPEKDYSKEMQQYEQIRSTGGRAKTESAQ